MNKQQSITLCFLYCFIYLIGFPLFEMTVLSLFQSDFTIRFLNAFEWAFYLSFPMIMLKQVYHWIRKEFYIFLNKPFKNLIAILKNYGLMMLSSICLNMILLLVFRLENSGNQTQLIEMYASQPWKVIYASLVFAPIVEELVFRGALFSPFRKKNIYAGYLISSAAFGFLHVYQSLFSGNFKDLLFILSYGLLGSYMCKTYHETDSIISSMMLHFINNFISVILTFMI